jgi:membrane fusion protein (multidrug efflux system)
MSRLHPFVPLTVAALCVLATACSKSQAAPAPAAPPHVSVLTVAPERVALSSEWVATLDGYVNAQVRPQVQGYLVARTYQEGAYVRKGQVLFEIDPRPFQAVLDQARAHLAEAQAQLGKAERDEQRDRPLADQHAIAQSQLDHDVQATLAAQAAVKSAEAAVETAELNVGFTKVTSLVDGIAAIATAQIGDLVGPTTLLTTVSQVDPIKAYFPLSEQEYLRMATPINTGRGSKAWAGGPLRLILADGSTYSRTGAFLAADREIDPKTGTIRVSATFPNPGHILRPGQYGRVTSDVQTIPDALLVPQRAVTQIQNTYQVRVVGTDDVVSTKIVMVGQRVGSRWLVTSGLTAGERVVVDGASTTDGQHVKATPYVAPAEGA